MKRHDSLLQTMLMVAALTLVGGGCEKPDKNKAASAEAAAPVAAEALSLIDFRIDKNQAGKSVLKGNVSSSFPKPIAHATAQFQLFDQNEKEVGTVEASVENLGARFSWSFEVEITAQNASSAKFTRFTAK